LLLVADRRKSLLRDPPVVGCISASMWTVITVRVLLALDLNTALAQEGTALSASQVEEIIVTAEKWEQAASTIGLSITTATDDMLQERECPTIGLLLIR
jgi:hypothetical protein